MKIAGDAYMQFRDSISTLEPGQRELALFYAAPSFRGKSVNLEVGQYNMDRLAKWGLNEVLSSVKVPRGLKFTIFEHDHMSGKAS